MQRADSQPCWSAASRPASHRPAAATRRCPTTPYSAASATASRSCSAGSRTGAASPCGMTAAGIGKLTWAGAWTGNWRGYGLTTQSATYPRHRFPTEIISHAVWLYHVFSLSLRGRRADSGRARRAGYPRKHPTLVPEVRSRLRQETAPAAAAARRHLAPRRGVRQRQGRAALSMAGGGPA